MARKKKATKKVIPDAEAPVEVAEEVVEVVEPVETVEVEEPVVVVPVVPTVDVDAERRRKHSQGY